jgi:hypothetical protein
MHGEMRKSVFIIAASLFVSGCGGRPSLTTPPEWRGRPHSRIDNNRLTLLPSGERLTVPAPFLEWYDRHRNNLHLSRQQLEAVRLAEREWDTEYAAVANASLPFDSCAAHIGGEGWGRTAYGYGDLQVRVYLGTFDPASVRESVVSEGAAAAASYFRPVAVDSSNHLGWERTRLRWNAFYHDYGGSANVEFYAQSRGDRTAIVVLMFSSYDPPRIAEQRDLILSSFAWQ